MTGTQDPFGKLITALGKARDEFEAGPAGVREGCITAINAVENYLADRGVELRLRAPVSAVTAALLDAERGARNRLLTPSRVSNRPPRNLTSHVVKAWAAAAMTLLIEAGDSKETAARTVANAMNRWPVVIDGKPAREYSWKQVDKWRDYIREGNHLDPSTNAYKAFFDGPGARKNLIHRETAMAMLDNPPAYETADHQESN